jgi:hypothetical protein
VSAAEVIAKCIEHDYNRTFHDTALCILGVLKAAGYAVVELPEANSTRYEGDEHESMDRLGWWQAGSPFGVTQWRNSDEVQLAYENEPFEPLSTSEARFIAAALLAAAGAAEVSA